MLKKLFYLLSLATFSLFQACNSPVSPDDPNQKGTVQFQFGSAKSASESSKVLSKTNTSTSILLTITNSSGQEVFKLKKIDLVSFSGVFITQPLDLKIGNYNVTEFVVINENNEAVYATPVKGSALANVVSKPLPVEFSVEKDKVSNLTLEVVKVGTSTPEDFGYASFKFDIIPVIDFPVSVSIYNSDIQGFVLTDASLKVENGSDVLYDNNLGAVTTTVSIKDVGAANTYKLTIKKSGYKTQTKEFSYDQLLSHKNSPIIFVLEVGQDEPTSSLTLGLVLYLPFSGNTNDESGSNNNGTNFGASLISDKAGNPNSAYSFNGFDNYIKVQNSATLQITGSLSMSVWFKTGGVVPFAGIICKANPFEPRMGYMMDINSENKLRADVIYDHSQGKDGAAISNNTVTDDQWHHAVAVYDGSVFKLYIDGQLDKEVSYVDGIQTNDEPLLIGWDENTWLSSRHFSGSIDEVRIYNRVLTESEITQLYTE